MSMIFCQSCDKAHMVLTDCITDDLRGIESVKKYQIDFAEIFIKDLERKKAQLMACQQDENVICARKLDGHIMRIEKLISDERSNTVYFIETLKEFIKNAESDLDRAQQLTALGERMLRFIGILIVVFICISPVIEVTLRIFSPPFLQIALFFCAVLLVIRQTNYIQ